MKYLSIGIILLTVLLVLCIVVNSLLGSRTQEVQSFLQNALEDADRNDYRQAALNAKKAADVWNEHLQFYASVLCHDETDEITAGFAELLVVEDAEFLQTASMLSARLAHIEEMDLPLLHNIF